jgi:hypothetical protein
LSDSINKKIKAHVKGKCATQLWQYLKNPEAGSTDHPAADIDPAVVADLTKAVSTEAGLCLVRKLNTASTIL